MGCGRCGGLMVVEIIVPRQKNHGGICLSHDVSIVETSKIR